MKSTIRFVVSILSFVFYTGLIGMETYFSANRITMTVTDVSYVDRTRLTAYNATSWLGQYYTVTKNDKYKLEMGETLDFGYYLYSGRYIPEPGWGFYIILMTFMACIWLSVGHVVFSYDQDITQMMHLYLFYLLSFVSVTFLASGIWSPYGFQFKIFCMIMGIATIIIQSVLYQYIR